MKRDMDLIRELLLKLEALPIGPGRLVGIRASEPELAVDGFTADDISHHLWMLIDAGFLQVEGRGFNMSGELLFRGITWSGHEFIGTIRDREIWQKTKEAAKKGGTEAIEFVWEIAKAIGKNELKKRTGLEF